MALIKGHYIINARSHPKIVALSLTTSVLHKYFNDETKLFCGHFPRCCTEFSDDSGV